MFKQFRDGLKARKIINAMNAADAAISADHIEIAEGWLDRAYNLLLDTTMPRTLHIEMITGWGLMGIALKERGHTDFADRCTKMSRLLQARFDAGDYYRETR